MCFSIWKSTNVTQHINQIKDRNHTIISKDAEKALDKMQHLFMIKAVKLGIKRMCLNIIKATCDKPITNIIPCREKPKPFPLNSEMR
jgi:hypothetical protein